MTTETRDDDDPMAVTIHSATTLATDFWAFGLVDALRAAADYITDRGQLGIWDITTDTDETGKWHVTVYEASPKTHPAPSSDEGGAA